MIFKTSDGQVETNVNDKKQFTINANAVAFEVLSGSIYKHPIKAIVRELATNAYDAHLDAGKADVPFEVHVPTVLEPFYSIRDFGKGLSVEEIDTVYTELFNSTKGHSNEAVGMLGLGSKTPFSYKDGSFDVVSFQGGKKFVYSAFMDLGLPNITFMGEYETEEADGLFVKLAVDMDDRLAFESAIEDSYQYFDVPPTLNKELDIVHPFVSDKKVLGADNWAILENSKYDYGSKLIVIMGNIGYSVNISDLKEYRLRDMLANKQCYIKVNIGDFKIQASRENLSISDQTITDLEALLSKIRADINGIVEKDLENCESFWEAQVKLSHIGKLLGKAVEQEEVEFDGKTLKAVRHITLDPVDSSTWSVVAYNSNGVVKASQYRGASNVIPMTNDIKILYINKVNGYKARIEEALGDYQTVVAILPPKSERKKEHIESTLNIEAFHSICEDYGFSKEDRGFITDYNSPVSKSITPVSKSKPVKAFKNIYYVTADSAVNNGTYDQLVNAKEVYYIPTFNGFYENSWKVRTICDVLGYMGSAGADVMFVEAPRSMIKKVLPTWNSIEVYFKNTKAEITDYEEVIAFNEEVRNKLTYQMKALAKVNTSKNFKKYLDTYNYAEGLYGVHVPIGDQLKYIVDKGRMPTNLGKLIKFTKAKCKKQATIEMFYKDYPLFSENIRYNDTNAVVAAIELQDKVRNVKSV